MEKSIRIVTRTCYRAATAFVMLSTIAFTPQSVLAEVVKVPVGSQAEDKKNIPSPTRGSSQTQVKSKLGDPRNVQGPVGEPPITAWEYDHYVVYFEFDKVLHTVYKH